MTCTVLKISIVNRTTLSGVSIANISPPLAHLFIFSMMSLDEHVANFSEAYFFSLMVNALRDLFEIFLPFLR